MNNTSSLKKNTTEWVFGITLLTVSLSFVPGFIHPFSTLNYIILRFGIVSLVLFILISIKKVRWHQIDALLLTWLTWQAVSSLLTTPWPQSGFKVEGILLLIAFYLIARATLSGDFKFHNIAVILVTPAIVQSIIGLLQFFHLFPPTSNFFLGYESQVFGTVGGSNVLGVFLAVSLPLVFFLIGRSTGKERMGWILSLALILIVLILTKSRGAWVATIIGLGVYKWNSISYLFRSLRPQKALILTLILVVGVILAFGSALLYRLNPDSASGRLFIWSVSWGMILDHLWTGVGHGNFGLNWLEYQGQYFAKTGDPTLHKLAVNLSSAHSQYIHILAETGVIGLGLFIGLILSIFSSMRKGYSRVSQKRRQTLITLFAALVILFTHSLVDDVLNLLVIRLQFLIILSLFVSNLFQDEYSEQKPMRGSQKWVRLALAPMVILLIIVSHDKVKGELLWKQGRDQARGGNWNIAIINYTKARQYLPHSAELEFYLGAAYSKIGKAKEAIKHIKSSQIGLSDKNQYIAIGKAYIDNGQYKLAKLALIQVLYYYPELLSPHYWLSRVYFELGDILKATQELHIILSADNILGSPEIEQVKADARRALIALKKYE